MSEENNSEKEVQPPAMGGMLLTMLFMVYILINPEMRVGMGDFAAGILEPQIGFEHEYPVLTFLFAGVLMISLTTIIRHMLIDWEKVAEIQAKMAADQRFKPHHQQRMAANIKKVCVGADFIFVYF